MQRNSSKGDIMKIGFLGLGKLGLPCALAVEAAGHEVMGYDPSPTVVDIMNTRVLPYQEVGAQDLLTNTKIRLVGVADLVECDLIFVAVQTPHHPRYEGVNRLPQKRVDFDYRYLNAAMKSLSSVLSSNQKYGGPTEARVVIISTVLPGTVDREIMPHLHGGIKLCYNPFFIAMGTTIHDFTNPEFVLFGVDDVETADLAEKFYKTIHDRPFYRTKIRNAELIKVAYNTFISTKIAFVNTLMEICHKTGADVDAVTDALKLADDRLISTKYLTAGMGDGGGCHPRDNIALSWLARRLDLGYDLFEAIMMQRERQTDWFADIIEEYVQTYPAYQVYIMGKSFKPETNLTVGSPSRLLESVLRERNINVTMVDPIVTAGDNADTRNGFHPAIYFIGTKHAQFAKKRYPKGSIVIDPHRYVPDQDDVVVIRLGEGTK